MDKLSIFVWILMVAKLATIKKWVSSEAHFLCQVGNKLIKTS